MNETRTRITAVETVALPVADQDRALKFYLGTLGFEKRRDVPFGPGMRWIEVAPPGATTTIALVPAGMPVGVRLTTEDAEADHASLRARGVDADPEIMRIGEFSPPMFAFRDPDGNSLLIVGGGPT
jgi:catechol 2,3-dioxygenase-like lactoylglutathione lyase family enzyme